MQRAVYNLLDNSVRHAGDNKWIGIMLEAENGEAIIGISDYGDGIGLEEL